MIKNMKTIITKQNLSKEKIREGLTNKLGLVFSSDKIVRKAIAQEVDEMLKEIRLKHAIKR